MNAKFAIAALIGAALSTAAMAANDASQTASAANLWQGSKFIHMNVYNDQNQKVGDIEELLLDKSGKVDSVAIAVGGYAWRRLRGDTGGADVVIVEPEHVA